MKILDITGNPFSRNLNNGKTHEAILSAFDKSELCQLFIRPVAQDLIDFDYCHSFYCVSDSDVIRHLTFRSKKCGSEVVKKQFVTENREKVYNRFAIAQFSYLKNIFRLLRDYIWNTGAWKTNELDDWLHKERPDAIFIDGGGETFIYDIALYVQKMLHIPMIYYVTDDFLISNTKKTFVSKVQYWRLKRKLKEVISKSSACYAIGEYMAKVYSDYFYKEFRYIMNSVPILSYRKPDDNLNKKYKISYFGSMSLNRDRMIAKFALMTRETLECNVYTFGLQKNSSTYNLLIEAGVVIHPAVKDKDLDEAMYSSSFLLHVESDESEIRAFTKLAISTKIPEYLIHCRPVIGFGPMEVASMKLLADNDIGLVISSECSPIECKKSIEQIERYADRLKLVKKGYEYAVENFDIDKNSKRFKNHIKEIISNEKLLI